MGNLLDTDSSFMGRVNTLCDLILLNLFFLISCLPIVTIGAAVSAMSHVTMKVVRNEEGGVWRTYWGSFRTSFKQATLVWLIFLALCAMLLVDFQVLPLMVPDFYPVPRAMVVIVFLVGVCVLLYLLPAISHFQYTFRQAIRNAALMVVAHFPSTVLLLALHGLLPLVCLLPQVPFMYAACLFLVFGFSALSLLSSYILNRIFARYESN